jgi:hypothetical protein
MPRFFFHVVNDISTMLDEEGTELADLQAACERARVILGEIIADEMKSASNVLHLTAMIDDADRRRVGTINTVTRIVTAPSPFAE